MHKDTRDERRDVTVLQIHEGNLFNVLKNNF